MDIPASLDEQIRCVKREIAMRKSAYPRFVAAGRMKLDAAEREIATMAAVLATLEGLRSRLPAPPGTSDGGEG